MPDLFPGRIKVCGMTNMADINAALECGVRTLGFIFYAPSSRYVTPETARRLIAQLPAGIVTVGVFVDVPPEGVNEIAATSGLNAAQLHGAESEEWAQQVQVPVIKAFRIRAQTDIPRPGSYGAAEAFLLDAWSPKAAGGTGQAWDWRLASHLAALGKPVALAGGLDAENVAAAIRQVRPAAVDVSSGLERSPGIKDHGKLRRFVTNALEAFDELD